MLGQIDVILHLMQLVVVNLLQGVLLRVEGLLLQSGVQLTEGQGRGVGAQSGPDGQMHGILHDADLQTIQIGQRVDFLVAGQVPEAVLIVAQTLQTILLQGVQQSLTGLAVHGGTGSLIVGEQEGSFKGVQRGSQSGDGSGRGSAHGDVALHAGLGVLTVTAQLLVGIDVHGDGTAGTLLQQLLQVNIAGVLCHGLGGAVGGNDVQLGVAGGVRAALSSTALVGGGFFRGAAAASHQGGAEAQDQDQGQKLFHACNSPIPNSILRNVI